MAQKIFKKYLILLSMLYVRLGKVHNLLGHRKLQEYTFLIIYIIISFSKPTKNVFPTFIYIEKSIVFCSQHLFLYTYFEMKNMF